MTDEVKTDAKKPKIPRQKMPEQDPIERAHNFYEVALGYDNDLALLEASRCLNCKKPYCKTGCPVEVDIPDFIAMVKAGDILGASWKLKEKNSLPRIAGRVCPQETQCESKCVLGKKGKGEPCAIGRLERYVADWAAVHGEGKMPELPKPTGFKVAVVGSGPAGLTLAGALIKKGVAVTVFEALHELGGVLVYGIPEFRLPKEIVRQEVDELRRLGVEFKTNWVVGRIETVDDLLEKRKFDAVFIGTGAGAPLFLKIPGENLNGVYSANEFLTRANLMKAYLFPETDTPTAKGKKVIVFGGGNVAMDSARTALRLGAEEVTIVYRRTMEELPARAEEVHHAVEEGVKFKLLTAPVEILGNEGGWAVGVRCQQMTLGEPDASGRRRPVPVEGAYFDLECDTAIVAIGNAANPLVPTTTKNLETNKWGNIVADLETGKTSRDRIWAGGDIVTGAATVILAMGAGRKAALSMLQTFGIS
jgi:glutamate synthase (NADPH/NADH) small chain|uniref:NADPH-dependent glutamate synthase n=1 Tax=Desulfomonile tiedjei TaxID=2358 RepID=A0A7C4ARY1_9BACT